jgi:hypothetical protein
MAAGCCLAVAACAGHRPYVSEQPENLRFRTAVESGVRAAADVYSVDAKCHAQPLGRVTLDRPALEIGLPAGRASLLVVEFAGSRFLGSQRTSMTKSLMFTPRPGRRYEARVEYRDSLYNVELKEIDTRSGASREVDARSRC